MLDLNQRPVDYESIALTTELKGLSSMMSSSAINLPHINTCTGELTSSLHLPAKRIRREIPFQVATRGRIARLPAFEDYASTPQ